MRLASVAVLFGLASATMMAQINVGEQKAEANLPFTMTTVNTFELPWRIAFLPDGRMLVTEKVGPVWLVSADGEKVSPVSGTPAVYWQGQNGMHGVFISPRYATDQSIYLTYAEPGDYGGGLALRAAVETVGVDCAVSFYGRPLPNEEARKLKVPLLLHYAGTDERINAGIPDFKAALDSAGVPYTIHMYPGTEHGFHNDSSEARYNEAAAKLAWQRTLDFFAMYLKPTVEK